MKKSTIIVILKRIVATIGIVLGFLLMTDGIHDFSVAKTWLDAFKGLFWLLVGGFAMWGFVDDFRYKTWPFFDERE